MSSTPGGSNNRRGQYTSRACNECRRRRCKCDGGRPTCGSCLSYGHECSWDSEEARRPPTKQLVETLRVKIQFLEDEIARLQASEQAQDTPAVSFSGPRTLKGMIATSMAQFPSQSRPVIPGAVPQTEGHDHPSRWLSDPSEHSSETVKQASNIQYQFIFSIDPSVPPNYLPTAAQQSLVCDWSRHLPRLDTLHLTRLEHDTLLDRCFKYSNSWLMSVFPQFFLSDMLRVLANSNESPEAECYSPLLHCSLLAFATALSDDPWVRQPQLRELFANRAKQLLYDGLMEPSLSLVQSLVMLSEYYNGLGENELGYLYLGMSIRAIRALELGGGKHRVPEDAMLAALANCCFWSIYSQDKVVSFDLHRGFDMRASSYFGLELPYIDWDTDRQLWSEAFRLKPIAPQPSRLTQVFAESCKLMFIAESILGLHHPSILGVTSANDTAVADIHWSLDAWLSDLPAELLIADQLPSTMPPHTVILNITYWWLLLQLHQPFYSSSVNRYSSRSSAPQQFDDLSSTLCDRAGYKIMFLVDLYDQWHGLHLFPRNMTQVMLAAGGFFAKQLESSAGFQQRVEAGIRRCVVILRKMADTWQCAEIGADHLEGVLQDQTPRPHVQTGHSSFDESGSGTPQEVDTLMEDLPAAFSEYMPDAPH